MSASSASSASFTAPAPLGSLQQGLQQCNAVPKFVKMTRISTLDIQIPPETLAAEALQLHDAKNVPLLACIKNFKPTIIKTQNCILALAGAEQR
jgi:hypothetical protein